MYGEMVLDYFNLNRPGMINFWPIMIIRNSGGFRGGALGASAPPAESMVKKS